MNKIMNTRIFQFLKVVFPFILLILAVIEIMKFTGDINVDMLRHEVSQIHFVKLVHRSNGYNGSDYSNVFL